LVEVDSALRLSLIIPAYNETGRLPPFLDSVREYLSKQYGTRYEVVVVDDGGQDGLVSLLERSGRDWPQLRWMRHEVNRGKGAAVRSGMLEARGDLLLFADADGATPIEEEARLRQAIVDGADIAVGSRVKAAAGVRQSRHWLRAISGRAFAALARTMLGLEIRDTQCGFKMFRREIGRGLFEEARECGFLFDLEILARAQRQGRRIAEVPVNWREVRGSHLSLLGSLPRVIADLRRLRLRLAAEFPTGPRSGSISQAD
jgi:dolichyl-phosphate beta-glucosyltransferase